MTSDQKNKEKLFRMPKTLAKDKAGNAAKAQKAVLTDKKTKTQNTKNAIKPAGGRQTTQNTKQTQQTKPAPKTTKTTAKTNAKTTTSKAATQSKTKKTNTPARTQKKSTPRGRAASSKLTVSFLGGLNEIGKNISLFECGNDAFLLDCGMAFPDGEMLGVDLVIPDFAYVEEMQDKIRGVVLTHGHEDHIGSIPYLLQKVNFPIYGTPLTLGLVENKLKEHNLLYKARLIEVNAGDTIDFGCIKVELIHVNHSIPDAVALAIHSPAGTVVHTGDFKIDFTPTWGDMIDLPRFASLGEKGVLALMADSTNAARPGYTMTEQKVADSFDNIFRKAESKRIIIASFASNISRVQQIIDCAKLYGRKVAFSGRSMINYMTVSVALGYLDVPDGIVIDIDLINKFSPEQIVIITTGSQGEPMSALSRMAYSDHRNVEVGAGDLIVISANPIPGNEKLVGNVVDELMKRGCEVLYEALYEVHVSGHACQEELKILYGLCKPKFCIPVHGEQKHLRKHAAIAQSMGIDKSNIFIGTVGNKVEISENGVKQLSDVPAGRILVDGLGVGDVGSIVLRDRKHLGQNGLIIVVATIDSYDGHIISGPDIVSRGFVYVRESEPLMDEIKRRATAVLEKCAVEEIREWGMIKSRMRDDISKLIYERTHRSPVLLPIIMDI